MLPLASTVVDGGVFVLAVLFDLDRSSGASAALGAGFAFGFLPVKLSIANFSTIPTGTSKAILIKKATKYETMTATTNMAT